MQKGSSHLSIFSLENTVTEATRLDAPIQRAPLMRWQRKALECGVRSLSLSESNLNLSGVSGPRSAQGSYTNTPGKTPKSGKTPHKSARLTPFGKSPGFRLTPSRGLTPGALNKTKSPSRLAKKDSKTPNGKSGSPSKSQLDRFIPNRSTTDFEASHFKLVNALNSKTSDSETSDTASERNNYLQKINAELTDCAENAKILSFKQKAPVNKDGHLNNLKVIYSGKSSTVKKCTTRHIPQQPERILDAPELLDDYYLNLLSWSCNNHLAVALGSAVYIWNAGNGAISLLCEMENPDEYVSCVSWIKEGNVLAVGNSLGAVQLWDVGQQKLVRTMGGHAARVGVLSWNSYILTSGSRSGVIHHHDVRVADHQVGVLRHHTQEVCGLAWSPDGRYLASGANDNALNIWQPTLGDSVTPLHSLTLHQAAVKAIAWCPWQSSLLASGGGTADRHIRLWNVNSGSCLNSVDTNSQVCGILWSPEHKELISGHGYSHFQLSIWKYPSMTRVTDLTSHTARILSMCLSPDGSTVASAAADETLRLWKCFAVDKKAKLAKKPAAKESLRTKSVLGGSIR